MKNRHFLLVIFSLLCTIKKTTAQGFDYNVLKSLSKIQSPSDTRFQKFVSNAAFPLTIGTPVAMIGIGLATHDKDLKEKGIQTGIALGLTVAETYLIKALVKRPRPYITYPELKNQTTEGSYSFPSGHTSSCFSIATSLSLNYPKWYVIIPAYVWAGATGYSRMYLNVHYPTDVLTGAALGSLTAWATWKINKKLQEKKKS
jgi:membrane-associated phospholipid phosphatase